MNLKFTKHSSKLIIAIVLFLSTANVVTAQQRVKKVVVQAFWWDYYNNNFRFKWADYLTELAPRLKALGVDAIWVPPNYKNDGPGSVGYGPFDQYDLGDKNQKGETASDTVRTRSGNKDELLRMIAVMHANGIEVIQDVVLNHQAGAGNRGGGGGRDYTAASIPYQDNASNYYKNFRYVCYGTPHLDTSAADYWTRKGRWSKNIMNFYPNANNNSVNTNAINTAYFGPDMAYENNSIGLSTNIPTTGSVTIKGITKPYFNAAQSSNYMAQGAKDWIVWYKKQTGADGFRWDAVKHFGYDVQRDLTYALKYQSGFANGGNSMFNVGEYVGQASEVDYYTSQLIKTGTPAESGVANEQLSGGFDFGLRGYTNGGLYSMVMSGGGFDMQAIPGCQQSTRYFDYPNGTRVYKTVPFVNSHDTYRPILTANGNYSQTLGNAAGWNTSQELGGNGQHIDPREPRFAAANAVVSAVDGNPCFFIEDVFDYFSKNTRWSHLPSNEDSLPLRKDVGNIMQCHQALKFKDGDYGVPTAQTGTSAPFYQVGSSTDHLVIERTGKAIIGITDAYSPAGNNGSDQQVYVSINNAWDTGVLLYDYSGAHGVVGTKIFSDRRVLIKTAPCGHNIPGVFGHGYSIWAPYPNGTPTSVQDLYNYLTTYNQPRVRTTQQEWEMADDLGDSHCASLGQGGQLPANSTNQRVAGKIYVQNGTNVAYYLKPSIDNTNISISLWDLNGNKLSEASGNSSAASPISGSYSATYTGWVTIKVRNANTSQPAQKVWANVTYTAPTSVNTRDSINSARTRASVWTGNAGTSDITDCGNWEEGKVPASNSVIVVPSYANPAPAFPNSIAGRVIAIPQTGNTYKLVNKVNIITKNSANTYSTTTIADGSYAVNSLVPNESNGYTIKPSKNNGIKAGGVNTNDVLFVQRHILNTTKLNSAYKLIAADVDGNKAINSVDVLRIKRLILSTDTTFASTARGSRLWEFVDSAYIFPDTTNPFPFKDSIIATASANSNVVNKTFIGIKLGDVNYDWQASQARGLNLEPIELQYSISNSQLETGIAVIKIPITANNFKDLVGMQYTLQFNKNDYELVNIENNKLVVDYNKTQANSKGLMSMLWTDAKAEEKSFNSSDELFTLVFKSRKLTITNDVALTLTNDLTDVEAWDKDYNQHNIILTKRETINDKLETRNEWFSVSPNPTSGEIKVSIISKVNKVVSFELTDAQGKTILKQSVELQKGNNNFTMNLKKNGNITTGVYFLKAVGIEGDNVKRIMVK